MSCFALRKSWRRKMQINKHKIERLDFRPGWYLWRLVYSQDNIFVVNLLFVLSGPYMQSHILHNLENSICIRLRKLGTMEWNSVVTALSCWKQLLLQVLPFSRLPYLAILLFRALNPLLETSVYMAYFIKVTVFSPMVWNWQQRGIVAKSLCIHMYIYNS